jgi:hypothetical protein
LDHWKGDPVTDGRLAEIERRLPQIEDERAIERLIASYGPLVDAGEAQATAQLWATDGSYDVEDMPMRSRQDVDAMVRSEADRPWLLSFPRPGRGVRRRR